MRYLIKPGFNEETTAAINGVYKVGYPFKDGTISIKCEDGIVRRGNPAFVIEPVNKGDSITIIGRRWFDKVNGNTYHSCECLINGKHAATVDFAYGYDRAYEYSGMAKLGELGYLPDWDNSKCVTWRYCQEKGITYHATHSDVNRKKDL